MFEKFEKTHGKNKKIEKIEWVNSKFENTQKLKSKIEIETSSSLGRLRLGVFFIPACQQKPSYIRANFRHFTVGFFFDGGVG